MADKERIATLLDAALDLLEEVEWEDAGDYDIPHGVCPWCAGYDPKEPDAYNFAKDCHRGHFPDCPWLALMRKAGRR